MPTESPAQAQSAQTETPPNIATDVLAESTIAMIGGAPKAEVTRVAEESKAALAEAIKVPPELAELSAEEIAAAAAQDAADAAKAAETAAAAEAAEAAEAARVAAEAAETTLEATELETTETPAGETPPAVTEDPKDQKRFRLTSAEDQAIAHIAKARGVSLLEASKLYEATQPKAPETVVAQPEPVTSPEVQSLEAKKAELEAKLTEYETVLGEGGLVTAEMRKADREYANVVSDLASAKLVAAQTAVAVGSIRASQYQHLAQAEAAYPDLKNHDSVLWKLSAQLSREAFDPAHPDHLRGQQIDAPRFFADKAAKMLNLQPQAKSAAPAKTIPGIPAKPGPVAGSKQTQAAPPAKPQAQKDAEKLTQTLDVISGVKRRNAPAPDEILVL
jgi:hypothetical protein